MLPLPDLRREEYQDIIGEPPSLLTRGGLYILSIGIVLLISIGLIVPYPETASARAQIISSHVPSILVSRKAGAIALLSVSDGDAVKRGQIVAVIDGNGNSLAMTKLSDWLSTAPLTVSVDTKLPAFPEFDGVGLGSATEPMLALLQSTADLSILRQETSTEERLQQLRNVARALGAISAAEIEKLHAAQLSLDASRRQYEARRKFVTTHFASPLYLDRYEAELDAQREHMADARISEDENMEKIADLQQQIAALAQERQEKLRIAAGRVADALRALRVVSSVWNAANILTAPEDGHVRFPRIWSDRQHIAEGETIAVIEPPDQHITAVAFVPSAGFGNVHIGQTATIRLDAYRAEDFGWLSGKVAAIAGVVSDGGKYRVLIELPHGLVTSSGRMIRFAQNMEGTVSIRTENISLAVHLIHGLKILLSGP